MWRPDLQSLRLFVAVCVEGSIARAADREAIDASAISKRINEIESASGVTLLRRSARGVKATEAGLQFLSHARQVLHRAHLLQDLLHDVAQERSRSVRVRADTAAIAGQLPRDLSRFRGSHPFIDVDLQEGAGPDAVASVRDGLTDFAICHASSVDGTLSHRPYAWVQLTALIPASHALAGQPSVACSQLLQQELICPDSDGGVSQLIAAEAGQLGMPWRPRWRARSYHATGHMVAERLGIGIVPLGVAQAMAAPLGLVSVPLSDAWARQRLVICHADESDLAAPALQLLTHLVHCSEHRDSC